MSLAKEIKERFQLAPFGLHMTHVDNLEMIFSEGKIWSYNRMSGRTYKNIANEDVQEGRAAKVITATGLPLHDYVPLYFGFKTPMAACNQHINSEFAYLTFSLDLLGTTTGIVISDGNARSNRTHFKRFNNIDDLAFLDVKAIQGVKYRGDEELKRKKQSEILVPNELPLTYLGWIIVFCTETQNKVMTTRDKFGIQNQVMVNKGWFFNGSQL